MLTQPLKISSPSSISLGRDSPVSAAVLSDDFPSLTMPSSGTFSPGLTSIRSPGFTLAGSTSLIPSAVFKLATSGFMSMSWVIDFLDLPTA